MSATSLPLLGLFIGALLTLPISVFSGLAVTPLYITTTIPSLVLLVDKSAYKNITFSLIQKILLTSLVLAALTLFTSINLTTTFHSWLRLAGLLALLIIALRCLTPTAEQQQKATRLFLLSFLFALLCIIEERLTEGLLSAELRNLLGNAPFDLSHLNRAACMLALSFWLLCYTRIIAPIPLILLGLITGATLLSLDSLAAVIGFFTAAICYAGIYLHKYFLYLWSGGVILGVAIIPLLLTLTTAEHLTNTYPTLPESAKHRLQIWEFTLEKIQEGPLLGWGLGSARHIPGGTTPVYPENPADDRVFLPLHPHNHTLHLWLELGLLGPILQITLLLAAAKHLHASARPTRQKAAMLASISAYFTIGMVAFGVWQNWWIAAGFFTWLLYHALASSSAATPRASAQN